LVGCPFHSLVPIFLFFLLGCVSLAVLCTFTLCLACSTLIVATTKRRLRIVADFFLAVFFGPGVCLGVFIKVFGPFFIKTPIDQRVIMVFGSSMEFIIVIYHRQPSGLKFVFEFWWWKGYFIIIVVIYDVLFYFFFKVFIIKGIVKVKQFKTSFNQFAQFHRHFRHLLHLLPGLLFLPIRPGLSCCPHLPH